MCSMVVKETLAYYVVDVVPFFVRYFTALLRTPSLNLHLSTKAGLDDYEQRCVV